jgi:hypothetical protein
MKFKNLKEKILKTLSLYPETRDCDIELTTRIWKEYYPKKLKYREADARYYVALDDLLLIPREDHIKRIRAVIQNEEHKYLPRKMEVRKKRKIAEEEWRKALNNGFNNY